MTALRLSLHGGLIALAVILLRLVLKKAPRALLVALWGLVALRLLLPFTVEFSLSAVPEVIGSRQVLEEWSEHTVGKTDVIYEGEPEYLQARKAGLQPRQDGAGKRYVLVGETPETPPRTVEKDLIPVLFGIWLAGMGLMLVYMALSYSRLHRLTLGAFRERGNVYRSERITSPFLLGVVRPRICLPVGLEEPELTYVLAHEQAHIARKDHWWKALGFWILCIHWFNPLLWIAYLLLCRDIEFACDACVAKSLSKEQLADYSQALLNCSLHEKRGLPCPLSFAETGVRERVKKILDYRKPGVWICLAVGVAACLCAVFLMTCSRQEAPAATQPPAEQTLPTVSTQEAPAWLLESKYPDANTFFKTDRAVCVKEDSCSWLGKADGGFVTYTLIHDPHSLNPNWYGGTLSVRGSDGSEYPMVAVSTRLENARLLGCDGRYAYLCEPWSGTFGERIVCLDLKTQLWETVAEGTLLREPVIPEDGLMYYLDCAGNSARVCRVYLPEKRVEVLTEIEDTVAGSLRLYPPETLLGSPRILWEGEEPVTPSELQTSAGDPERPWLTEPLYPARYVDYYQYNRVFDITMDPVSWQPAGTVAYTLIHEGSTLSVKGSDGTVYEKVFQSEALIGGRLLCCDGRYAWFCEGWDGNISYRRISRVDLKTGQRQVITEQEKLWDVQVMEGIVLYYLAYDGERVTVCSIYLPEAEEWVRYTMYLPERLETEEGSLPVIPEMVELTPPETRNGNPTWELTTRRAEG